MELTYLNEHTSCHHPLVDFIYIRPLLLLSDTLNMHSPPASILATYINYNKWTYGDIVVNFKLLLAKDTDDENFIQLDNMYESWKRIKPSHDKEYVDLKNVTKSLFDVYKAFVYNEMQKVLARNMVIEVLPFAQNEVFKPAEPPCERHFEIKYDSYVRFFEKALLKPGNYMVLPDIIDKYLHIFKMGSKQSDLFTQKDTTDVIGLKLVRFPILSYLTSQELEYTRKNVLRALEPLTEAIKVLDEKLIELDFGPASLKEIVTLVQENIAIHVSGFQANTDKELFIQGAWNKTGNGYYTDICLGVTSLHNLVRYYQLANILQEARAHKVMQAISRDLPPESCVLFFYFDSMPKEKTQKPDGNSTD